MSAVSAYRGFRSLPAVAIVAILAATGSALFVAAPARAAETIDVQIDNARLMAVPERTATIVIGNPTIADVSLQGGGVLVVTGKSFGSTNFLALDRAGKVLAERQLVVSATSGDIVSVYYGVQRATLNCNPQCQPRVMLGDGLKIFEIATQQIEARNGLAAQGSAPAVPQAR
jgi:Flp pilus assembly secretin CpaC